MFSTVSRHIRRCLMGIFFSFIAVAALAAAPKKLLIINSYDEPEPWANDLATPISMYLAGIDDVVSQVVNLDNALIDDMDSYNQMIDNVFSRYESDPPKYVVMLGNFAFTLRDRIKEEWGDIPILLISRLSTFGTIEDNFCSNTRPITELHNTPLAQVRDQYNFTAIILPDHGEECVDLMVRLNPDMTELVLLSTNTYISRYVANEVETHLKSHHPSIHFTWVKANANNAAQFQDYMANRSPGKGFLLASWVYGRNNARGLRTLTANDLRLIPSSKNPIFSLRESYIDNTGCIGGVYNDRAAIKAHVINIVQKMLDGKSMRNEEFATFNTSCTVLNYRLLAEYGINEDLCPDNTVFIGKPAGYWEKYLWQTLTCGLLFILFVAFVWWKISTQNTRLARMKYDAMFINNMPVPFAKADIHYGHNGKVHNIVYAKTNDAFTQLIEKNAIPGNPFLLFPADFISEKTNELLRTGKNVKFTYHFDKTDTWYNFTLCNVLYSKKDGGGMQSVVDVFANNITDRLKLESQLRLTAHKLQLALSVSGTVPWQWHLKTGLITFDDMGQLGRTLSYKTSGANGQEEWVIQYEDFIKRIHPDDKHMLVELRKRISNGTAAENQLQMRIYKELHSDETDWIQIYSAVTDTDTDGSPIVTGTLKIISDQKQQEADMARAKEKAEESDRMKSVFLANMSHEIRTPLNAIVGFSNLIAETTDEAERAEFRDIINHNSDLLLCLINDVLDLAKIESNAIDINYTVADINAILQSAEQSVKLRVHPDVRLNMVLGSNTCITEADPVRLSQVLINLLTNACKFTSEGSITFGYKMQGRDTIYFYVSDTGIGISEEGQKKIFDRFTKLNTFAQGTGLGLSICKRLVEIMGGEIGVESDGEGRGSLFWFTLPYVSRDPESVDSATASSVHPLSSTEVSDHHGANGKPLMLVAEDHDSNYKLIVHMMKERYTFLRAVNGKEAVELFNQHHPEIILMDINMPIMDGYEAVAHIRETDRRVPIIAVTAYAYASDRVRIMNSGFDAYVAKPVSHKVLNEVLERIKNGGAKRHR